MVVPFNYCKRITYPFGMEMKGAWITQVGTENGYQYTGKELNEDWGLNWSDYGARWYDAAIGRWNAIDPIAEQFPRHSGYTYALNNPINNIDVFGLAPKKSKEKDPIEEAWEQTTDGENKTFAVVDGALNGSSTEYKEDQKTLSKSDDCCPDDDPSPFILAEFLYNAWWAVEDGIGNLVLLPLLPDSKKAKGIRNLAKEYGLDLSSLSDREVLANVRLKKINGEIVLVPQVGFLEKLVEDGLDVLSIAAAFYGGNSVLVAKGPNGFKFLNEAFAKANGIDAHALKKAFLGNKAQIAHYDLYKQTKTGEIWIFKKGGIGEGIPTGEKIE